MERFTKTTLPQARRRTVVTSANAEDLEKKLSTSQGERTKYHLNSDQNSPSIYQPGLLLNDFPLVQNSKEQIQNLRLPLSTRSTRDHGNKAVTLFGFGNPNSARMSVGSYNETDSVQYGATQLNSTGGLNSL